MWFSICTSQGFLEKQKLENLNDLIKEKTPHRYAQPCDFS